MSPITEAQFKAFIQPIITEILPEESLSFDIAGDEIIENAFSNKENKVNNIKGSVNFLEHTTEIIEFVSLIFTTYKVMHEVYKLFKKDGTVEKPNAQDVEKTALEWEARMIRDGIEPKKAQAIGKKFTKQLLETVKQ